MSEYRYPIMGRMTCGDSESEPVAHAFAAAQGLHWWLSENHEGQWSEEYRMLCELDYNPGALERGPEDGLAQDIYDALGTGDADASEVLSEILAALSENEPA